MQTIKSINEMKNLSEGLLKKSKKIAFVPTMGCLHEGHWSLVKRAKESADVVVLSIFVNPLQFGPNDHYKAYPRNIDNDILECEKHGVDIIFSPEEREIYPNDFSSYITEFALTKELAGASRNTILRGYSTIISILVNIIRPHFLFLGQKDPQQTSIVRKLIQDLHIPVELVTSPIIRDQDGLALSTYNQLLQPNERQDALRIYQALSQAEKLVQKGIRSVERIHAEVTHYLSNSLKLRVIYVSIVDPLSLKPLPSITPENTLLSVAVWINQVRLNDNIIL